MFFRQLGVIIKKDLLVIGIRSFRSTVIRALIWPVIFIVVLVNIKTWIADHGLHGVGDITPLKAFSDALSESGNSRPRIVIVNNGITDGNIGKVVEDLSSTIRNSNKELHIVPTYADLVSLCPTSNTGVSPCYGAVQFYSSPDQGDSSWNYTYYEDGSIGGTSDVSSTSNDRQIYTFPFLHAISDAISRAQNGSSLPQIQQFPYTSSTQEQIDKRQAENWQRLVATFMGFAFFIAFSGICYHLPGYVTREREQGLLGLMDAMMQHRNRWHPFIVRTLATHISFDIIYFPSWIIIGGVLQLSFPTTNVGWLILTSILFGLALTSYSILVSSLFKRSQLAAIIGVVAAMAFSLVAEFAESPYLIGSNLPGALATGLLFPPSTFIYIINNLANFEVISYPFDVNANPPHDSSGIEPAWEAPTAPFIGFFVFQFILYPILAIIIEKFLWGTASRRRVLRSSEELGLVAVKLDGFSRHFKNRKNKKKAVKAADNLSLDVHQGSITILLGHNGSGKSTTLNAIAGLETITSGSIEVDGTGGIGICPQKNVMWDSLTVEENISVFECLKSSGRQTRLQHKEEVIRLIEGCDLNKKTKSKAKTLSGGQKRKLQLAMMFAGGSKVCCIDEASSGIDPLARRKIWDILLAERGHRSMLLTTHFLDEADVLSDHVIIMSKGEKRAEGPVAALKRQLGGGYRVMILGNVQLPQMVGVKRSSDYTYTVFETEDKAILARIVMMLEQKNMFDYRIQGPTIENVFLKLIDEVKESKVAAEFVLSEDADKRFLELHTGKGCGFWQQVWVLFKKRLMILRHNYMPYVCALFASLVVAGLVTRFLLGGRWSTDNPNGLLCFDPTKDTNFAYIETLNPSEVAYGLTFGPPSLNSTIQRLVPKDSHGYYSSGNEDWSQMTAVNSSAALYSDIVDDEASKYFGGFYVGSGSPVFAWQAESWSVTLGITLLDSILLNQTLNVGYQKFAASYVPGNTIVSLLVVFTSLGFAIYPCLFALYPTAERLRKVRAMQYSNGIRASSLWTAHALFDLMFVLVISILTVVIWITQWSGWYGIGYMFVVFFLYGLASTTFSYVISKLVKSQVAALAITLVVQVVIAMLFFLACALIVDQAPPALVNTWMNYVYFTIGIISPAVHLSRGLSMAVNNWSLVCRGTVKASYPGEITIYGGPILYLTLQFVLLLLLLIYWESGWSLEVLGIRRKVKENGSIPHDTMESSERLSSQNTGLRVTNVSKHFGKNRAVDNVSFGILPSEKFALTGINGAGKTTLISLIRGDLHGTGSIHIGGDSIRNSPMAAKSHLGVCPQFDAQDLMTVKEHLKFYASAREVPNKEHNINLLIEQLGLTAHVNKLAKKLSGGNQRKLSLAIALVGNPSVLLLDEPSSGMDPAAKRALWETLSAVSAGRSLLITTHSMEEADALCDRAGIMSGKLLALGDMEELRQQHGDFAFVHMVHKDAPHSNYVDVESMRSFVLGKFPDAQLEMKSFGGQLRFSIPRTGMTLGQLYKLFEEHKDELGVAEYSVGPATLNEVFLNVMREHDVQEENAGEKDQKWYSV